MSLKTGQGRTTIQYIVSFHCYQLVSFSHMSTVMECAFCFLVALLPFRDAFSLCIKRCIVAMAPGIVASACLLAFIGFLLNDDIAFGT